eukprot:765014-Hanusia_phi.AAC.4
MQRADMALNAMPRNKKRPVQALSPLLSSPRTLQSPLFLSSLLCFICLTCQAQPGAAFQSAFWNGIPSPVRTEGQSVAQAKSGTCVHQIKKNARLSRLPPMLCKAANEQDLLTLTDVEKAAAASGFSFTVTQLGPLYRVMIRKTPEGGREGEKGEAIGYTAGTIVGDLMRQDTMRLSTVNTGNPNSMTDRKKVSVNERGWRSNSVYGLSLLLGAYAGRYAYEKGCKRAELLAIKDNERQHKILERHYRRLGFRAVKDVTDDITCVGGERHGGGERGAWR